MNLECQQITSKDGKKVVDFLLEDEKTCISLMSCFVKAGEIKQLPPHIKGYKILFNQEIVGIFTISDGGSVLHYFKEKYTKSDNENYENLKKLIFAILSKKNVYSIIGNLYGTRFLMKVIEGKRKPKIQINYTLMTFNRKKNQDFLKLDEDFFVKKCSRSDFETLYPLQAAYDLVEVLPPGEKFNPDNCRITLRYNLGYQHIYGIVSKSKKQIVAKAGTNALGLNWVQIGGVFTREEFRGRGFASFLVNYISKIMTESDKKVALFVKVENKVAQKAYLNAGFEPISSFGIFYY